MVRPTAYTVPLERYGLWYARTLLGSINYSFISGIHYAILYTYYDVFSIYYYNINSIIYTFFLSSMLVGGWVVAKSGIFI